MFNVFRSNEAEAKFIEEVKKILSKRTLENISWDSIMTQAIDAVDNVSIDDNPSLEFSAPYTYDGNAHVLFLERDWFELVDNFQNTIEFKNAEQTSHNQFYLTVQINDEKYTADKIVGNDNVMFFDANGNEVDRNTLTHIDWYDLEDFINCQFDELLELYLER
ncbi:hypothetical protein [Oligella sp. HMSC09E12]|uniref:hypothetical protein n=1 Tax=Oligella sp. HMSC09E12 TaxID=1581147 RepID=UPI0008A577D0|nr:hypothetical protein [Oligella sp. HMSC09E12]OFV50020.1 hypothetical protein HMPREF3179_03385 [Oligella sp. HMSC09E12]